MEKKIKKVGYITELDENIIRYLGHDGHLFEIKSDGSISASAEPFNHETKPLGHLNDTKYFSIIDEMKVAEKDMAECISKWLKEYLLKKDDVDNIIFDPDTWFIEDETDLVIKSLAKNRQMALESDEYKNCGFRIGSKVRLSDHVRRSEIKWNDPPTKEDKEWVQKYEEKMKKSDENWNGAIVTVSDALILYNPFTYEPLLCICVNNGIYGDRKLEDYKTDIAEVIEY